MERKQQKVYLNIHKKK